MTREEKIQEIYKHAKKLGSNLTTLVFLMALTNDKGVTKFHKEFMEKSIPEYHPDYPPLYVRMGENGTAMRLRDNGYWRDGGEWGVNFKYIDGYFYSWHWGYGMPWLHRVKLIRITEKEWRKDNGQYVSKLTKAYRKYNEHKGELSFEDDRNW